MGEKIVTTYTQPKTTPTPSNVAMTQPGGLEPVYIRASTLLTHPMPKPAEMKVRGCGAATKGCTFSGTF